MAEISEVGCDKGSLVQVTELLFLGPYDVGVTKGVLQGFDILLKGLKLVQDPFGSALRDCLHVLVKEWLKPIIRGSVKVAGGKENLLGFGQEELKTAEEVMVALEKVKVKLMLVDREYVEEGEGAGTPLCSRSVEGAVELAEEVGSGGT